jgi:hypothetical protein
MWKPQSIAVINPQLAHAGPDQRLGALDLYRQPLTKIERKFDDGREFEDVGETAYGALLTSSRGELRRI